MSRWCRSLSPGLALLVACTWVACMAPPLRAQDLDYVLAIEDQQGFFDSVELMTVTLTSSGDAVTAFQFDVCDDALVDLDFGQVVLGSSIDERLLSSLELSFGEDRWSVSASLPVDAALTAGTTHEILLASYELLEVGTSTIAFCASTTTTQLTTADGSTIEPVVEGAAIEILESRPFLRGDANGDGRVDALVDAAYLLTWAYAGGDPPQCMDAADVDNDGDVEPEREARSLAAWFFRGSAAPPSPGTEICGLDPELSNVDCATAIDPCGVEAPVLEPVAAVRLGFGKAPDALLLGEAYFLPVNLTVEDDSIQGVQFGVCHDAGVEIEATGAFGSVDLQLSVDSPDFGFAGFQAYPDGWTFGGIAGDDAPASIPPGEYELTVVEYEVIAEGIWEMSFCDTLGTSAVSALALQDLALIRPEVQEPITIEGFVAAGEGIAFASGRADPGEEARVGIYFNNLDDDVQGWRFGVCHEEGIELEPGNLTDGDDIAGLFFDSYLLTFEDGGWTSSAVLDASAGSVLPAGARNELFVAYYTVLEEGIFELTICDTLGDPPVPVLWTVGGVDVEPDVEDGFVGGTPALPFKFAFQIPPIPYDPEDLSGGIQFRVGYTVTEHLASPNFPDEVVALTMAVEHDDTVLDAIFGEAGEALASLSDGEGPDFVGLNVDPDGAIPGVYAGIIISLIGSGPYPTFEVPGVVLDIDYEVVASGLAELEGNSEGMATPLAWSELGLPPVGNLLYTILSPAPGPGIELVNGDVQFTPWSKFDPFLRGDCDGNGSTSPISDALFLLRYGFLLGDEPPCLDAADVDDSGVVDALIDTLVLLDYAFSGGEFPPAPGPTLCNLDPTDDETTCQSPPASCL